MLLATLVGVCLGYTGIEHAWIGCQTYDVWQSYDWAFYNELVRTYPLRSTEAHNQAMLRKFYLIGCNIGDANLFS
jgi:hypothetical protein